MVHVVMQVGLKAVPLLVKVLAWFISADGQHLATHFAAPRLQPAKIVVGRLLLATFALSKLEIHSLAEGMKPAPRCSELSCLILILIFVCVSNDLLGIHANPKPGNLPCILSVILDFFDQLGLHVNEWRLAATEVTLSFPHSLSLFACASSACFFRDCDSLLFHLSHSLGWKRLQH